MTSSCQSKRRQSDYRYIWNQITLLVDESVPVLLLYNMAFCSYSASLESILRCGSSSNDAQDGVSLMVAGFKSRVTGFEKVAGFEKSRVFLKSCEFSIECIHFSVKLIQTS